MKQQDAETLSRAGAIEEAVIQSAHHRDAPGKWIVKLYGQSGRTIHDSEIIETARGQLRMFASLDTAYAWLKNLPGLLPGKISIAW